MATPHAFPSVSTSSLWIISCPALRPTDVIRAVHPVAKPLMTRLSTSTVTTDGRD